MKIYIKLKNINIHINNKSHNISTTGSDKSTKSAKPTKSTKLTNIIDESISDNKLDESEIITDLFDIKFSDLSNKYTYIKINNFRLVIKKSNNFVNTTHLCKSVNKSISTWLNIDFNKILIKNTSKMLNIDNVVIKITDDNNKINGTYVHPNIIIYVAQWCGISTCCNYTNVITQYHIYKNQLTQQSIIDKLTLKNNNMKSQIQQLSKQVNKLDAVNVENIITLKSTVDNLLIIIKYERTIDSYNYHVLRGARSYCKQALNHHDCEILLVINHVDNPMTMWKNIKNNNKIKIDTSGCNFNIIKGYDQYMLIKDIKKML